MMWDGMAEIQQKAKQAAHTTIIQRPPSPRFKCVCGCVYETEIKACRKTVTTRPVPTVRGEFVHRSVTIFWSHCPVCGTENADPRFANEKV